MNEMNGSASRNTNTHAHGRARTTLTDPQHRFFDLHTPDAVFLGELSHSKRSATQRRRCNRS
jgi:hypothetical protein